MPPTFADLGVPSDLVAALSRRSILEPFPIQAATLPDALAGRDVCGKAPTGSGKTLAFGIAAIARLGNRKPNPRRPRVLILTPTRELCAQVATELSHLATPRGMRVASFYGGVGYQPQIKALSRGLDVAVACPGRLEDLLQGKNLWLDEVEVVVVDEADRMADMGFLPAVKRLLDRTPEDRQTLLFSATLDGDVDVLVKRYQNNPARHELEETEEFLANSEHLFWKVESTARADVAARIAASNGPTIVFCRTRHSTDRTARQLTARGVKAVAIHGDRSQAQREKALAAFANGQAGALVATDVAARGIHVDGVAVVVHFDPPADAKDYTHRSGRTARAGATGLVVSLVTPEKAQAVKKLQRELGFPQGIHPPDQDTLGPALLAVAPTADDRSSGSSSSWGGSGQSRGSNQGSRRPEGQGRPSRPRPGAARGNAHRRPRRAS